MTSCNGGGSSDNSLATVKIDGKVSCINKKGKLVVPAIYDGIGSWSEGLAAVILNGKLGFIDHKGKQVIPLIYNGDIDALLPYFSEGLVAMNKNNVWGYIDKTGIEVIPFQYNYAEPFSEGYAAVQRNGKWGIIDKNDNQVINNSYEIINSISEGLTVGKYKSFLRQFNRWEILDTMGQIISSTSKNYNFIGVFSEGLASVFIKNYRSDFYGGDAGKYGYIDENGRVVIPVKYDYYFEGDELFREKFHEGLARVSKGEFESIKYGFVDKTGKEVIPLKYDWVTVFNGGLAAVVLNNKFGFINRNGEEVVPPIYDNISRSGGYQYICFSEDLAAVQKDDQWGFIDKTGNTIIPFKYQFANNFFENLAYTSDGFIDKTGKVIIPSSSLQKYEYVDNFVAVNKENK